MGKTKERSNLEYLKSQIKTKDKIIKNLKREVSRMNKRSREYEEQEEIEAEEHLKDIGKDKELLSKNVCPKCSFALDLTDLGMRKIFQCVNPKCDYRSVIKLK